MSEDSLRRQAEELLNIASLRNLDVDEQAYAIGVLVDWADISNSETFLKHALVLAAEIEPNVDSVSSVQLRYNMANAWATALRFIPPDDATVLNWDRPEHLQALVNFRKARALSSWNSAPPALQAALSTNLGNLFSNIGRTGEALDLWREAQTYVPNHGMAIGNQGQGLFRIASLVPNPTHQATVAALAHGFLSRSLKLDITPEARAEFTKLAKSISDQVNVDQVVKHFPTHDEGFGNDDAEIAYRRWVAEHGLFLNALNDAISSSLAADDSITLPTFLTSSPTRAYSILSMFNQLKQEYVAARLLFYDGVNADGVHFADRRVLLVNTLDYPSHNVHAEKIKLAFRSAYSLFDKIANFLNYYFELGIEPRDVTFRRLWYESDKGSKLRSSLVGKKNWQLRGLYWLSKDLHEARFLHAADPDARQLAKLRHTLEHRYLKVQDELGPVFRTPDDPFRDEVSVMIVHEEFVRLTNKLLKLVRATILQLVWTVTIDVRQSQQGPAGPSPHSLKLDYIEDDWKRL